MGVLLDTNIIIVILRGKEPPSLLTRLAEQARDDVFISAVTAQEVLYGFRRRPGADEKERQFERLLEQNEVLPFDLSAARICAGVAAELAAQGKPVELADLQIASIALAHNLALITGNTRHFRRIPGLRVYDWLDA